MRARRNRRIKIIVHSVIDKEKRWPPKLTDILVIVLAILTLFVAIITLWVAHYEGSSSDLQNKEIDSIASEIQQVKDQINYLSKIKANQENEINSEYSQLKALQLANSMLQLQGKYLAKETNEISKQLELSETEQAQNINLAFLTKRMYVTRLMNTIANMRLVNPNLDLEDYYMNNEKQLAYLKGIKDLMEKELDNHAVLENYQLFSKWRSTYDTLTSAVILLEYASRATSLYDPIHPGMRPEEIKHNRFTSAYFQWGTNMVIITNIIKKDYKEYLAVENN